MVDDNKRVTARGKSQKPLLVVTLTRVMLWLVVVVAFAGGAIGDQSFRVRAEQRESSLSVKRYRGDVDGVAQLIKEGEHDRVDATMSRSTAWICFVVALAGVCVSYSIPSLAGKQD